MSGVKTIVNEEILTPAQVAEYLHISVKNVYKLLNQKDIPSIRFQRQYRILKSDFEIWLKSSINTTIYID